MPTKFTTTIQPGAIFEHVTGSAAGYGDPLDRDFELVLRDVLDQKVSIEAARDEYGVVIDEDFTVDRGATESLREQAHRTPHLVTADHAASAVD